MRTAGLIGLATFLCGCAAPSDPLYGSSLVETFKQTCMTHLADYEGSVAALRASGFQDLAIADHTGMGGLLDAVSPRNTRLEHAAEGQNAIVASSSLLSGGDDRETMVQCSIMSPAGMPASTLAALQKAIKTTWPTAEVWSPALDAQGRNPDPAGTFFVRLGDPADRPLIIRYVAGPEPSAPAVEVVMLMADRLIAGAVN